jgi:hypothetical protein
MSVRDDARSTRSAVGSANGHCKPTSHIQSSYRVLWRSYQETGHSLFESQKRENGIVRTSRDNLRSPLIPTYFGDPHFLGHIFAIASAYAPLMRDRSTKSTRQHHLFPHVVTTMSVVHILWNMAINDTVARFRGQVVSAADVRRSMEKLFAVSGVLPYALPTTYSVEDVLRRTSKRSCDRSIE